MAPPRRCAEHLQPDLRSNTVPMTTSPMSVDFLDAHERHWEDAEYLLEANRLANADHLYGMATECGLKCLMEKFGMRLRNGTPENKKDKAHANDIWVRYETYRSGHHSGASYLLPASNPYADWDVNQRYARRNNFVQSLVVAHRQGVEVVRKLLDTARKDGLI